MNHPTKHSNNQANKQSDNKFILEMNEVAYD